MTRKKSTSPGDGGAVVDNPAGDSPATHNGEEKRQPIQKIRMRNITAAIWKNESERGPWYSVTTSRSYRDAEGQWHTTESYSGPDLLILAEVARAAFLWIVRTTQQPTSQPAASSEVVSNGNGVGAGEEIPF